MRRFLQCFWFVLLCVSITSCGAKFMILKDPLPRPTEGKALINFVRPSFFAKAQEVTIWDGERLIGVCYGQQAFQYECAPGKHLFLAWSEFKSPVEAELLPDRVYYVVLRTRMGGWRARIHQIPVHEGHPLWEQALTWQKTLPNYTFEQATIEQLDAKGKPRVLKYLAQYDAKVKGTKHVQYLRAEDGVLVE